MEPLRIKFLRGLNLVAEGELTLYPERMPVAGDPNLTREEQVQKSEQALLGGLLRAEQLVNSECLLRMHIEAVIEE